MQKFPGIPVGNFMMANSREFTGIPEREFPVALAGSDNLALLHCSCLYACLAAYSNILRRYLNTTCITV